MEKSFVQKEKKINPHLKWRVAKWTLEDLLQILLFIFSFANLYSVRLINGVPIFQGDHTVCLIAFQVANSKRRGGGVGSGFSNSVYICMCTSVTNNA